MHQEKLQYEDFQWIMLNFVIFLTQSYQICCNISHKSHGLCSWYHVFCHFWAWQLQCLFAFIKWIIIISKIFLKKITRIKEVIQVCHNMRLSKWWQNYNFWLNYPFNKVTEFKMSLRNFMLASWSITLTVRLKSSQRAIQHMDICSRKRHPTRLHIHPV